MSTNFITLNFINQSNDANNSDVVIFQKNEAPLYQETAVAWRVIQNCKTGDRYPVKFPLDNYISASDSFGNFTPMLIAHPGDAFHLSNSESGDALVFEQHDFDSQEIYLKNNLATGAISANIFKDGKLLAPPTNLVPEQMATFVFSPTIYIAALPQITEGQLMNAKVLSTIKTQISLIGIVSADIVMTGGGKGATAKPFQFTLQNVK